MSDGITESGEAGITEDRDQVIASLDAATINAMADAAAELPVALLHRSAHDEATSFALTGLVLLANARRSKVNIGDRMVAVLAELRDEAVKPFMDAARRAQEKE